MFFHYGLFLYLNFIDMGSQETAQNSSKLEVAAVICSMMKAFWLVWAEN